MDTEAVANGSQCHRRDGWSPVSVSFVQVGHFHKLHGMSPQTDKIIPLVRRI